MGNFWSNENPVADAIAKILTIGGTLIVIIAALKLASIWNVPLGPLTEFIGAIPLPW